MRYLLPFLLFSLLVSACKPKKDTGTPAGDGISTLSEAELIARRMADARFVTDWMDARANLRLESPEMNVSGNAYLRLEKDKRIWVSVKKFGFEAARALITPDSFFVINRLQGEYTAEPLSYVERTYKIPARFDLLQNIILGNPIILSRNLAVETTVENQYHLSAQDSRWASDYWANTSTFYLEQMKLREITENRILQIFMDDFQETGGNRPFPFGREIEIESPATGLARIKLDFTRIELAGPVDMPFDKR